MSIVILVALTCCYGIGYSNPGSFEFSVGLAENSSQCFKVTILDNDFVEDDEELVLTIVSLDPNAFVVIAQGYDITTLHIKEDPKDCKHIKCCAIYEKHNFIIKNVLYRYRNSLDKSELFS